MSRMAIHSRPMWLRTRFLAMSANTTRKTRQNRYLLSGVSMGIPNALRLATFTDPEDESLVNHLMRRKAQSQKNCAASVATARYSPLMRKDGMPNSTPTTVEHTPPSRMAMTGGMPSTRMKKL